MYKSEEIKQMLFIDIETASSHENYKEFSKEVEHTSMTDWWGDKASYIRKDRLELLDYDDATMYNTQAAIFPEFGRIVCITIGQVKFDESNNPIDFKMRSFLHPTE